MQKMISHVGDACASPVCTRELTDIAINTYRIQVTSAGLHVEVSDNSSCSAAAKSARNMVQVCVRPRMSRSQARTSILGLITLLNNKRMRRIVLFSPAEMAAEHSASQVPMSRPGHSPKTSKTHLKRPIGLNIKRSRNRGVPPGSGERLEASDPWRESPVSATFVHHGKAVRVRPARTQGGMAAATLMQWGECHKVS